MDRALGQAPEIFEWLQAPPTFSAQVDLPDRIEHAEATLLYSCGLIVQMLGWLATHHLTVTKVLVELKVRFHSASTQKETFRFLHNGHSLALAL
ncbi:hypothetical protein [Cupriavidus sp. UME77]|uniref:hypothetical protein n=1 Tax=Cupriavidus sp. UME77 TaxID=1862321 RepID=UPI0016042DE3|nr:hypothetical protein [Cupriavidus sp. UME77]MBB1632649.1 hypothetical protein [Cupriavidus sp. UME77]